MGKYPEIQAQEQIGILHINFLWNSKTVAPADLQFN